MLLAIQAEEWRATPEGRVGRRQASGRPGREDLRSREPCAGRPGPSCPGEPVGRAGANPTVGSEDPAAPTVCQVGQNSVGRGMEARDRGQARTPALSRLNEPENLRTPREHWARRKASEREELDPAARSFLLCSSV